MTTVLNRDSIKVKRDLQRRVENWVIEYCDALEENFKQYSIDSYKRNIESPNNKTVEGYKSYYHCLLYTSPSPRDKRQSRMPSSA